ncbi:MAG: tetratricopeptide repeat protein [Chloroflexota bacterium]
MTAIPIRAPRPRAIGLLVSSLLLATGTVLAGWSGLGDRMAAPASGDAATLPNPASPGERPPAASVPIPGAGAASLPAGSLAQLDHNIAAWTKNLEANPRDFISATNLATLYHARARLAGDLADHERALEAARTAISIAPTQPGARLLEASVLFSLHDFGAAHAAADALYREDPNQVGALATRADAAIELGDLAAARRDLEALASAAPGPGVDVRRARLAYLSGDLDGAVDLARRARDGAHAAAETAGTAVHPFFDYALGEYARLAGDPATARTGYEAALAIREGDLGARIGLARVLAFEGELDEAIAALEMVVATAPLPEAFAALGESFATRAADPSRSAAERAADLAAADAAFTTVRRTPERSLLAGIVYQHELLRFELDHDQPDADLDATLATIRSAVTGPTDSEGRDLVAWGLYRLGRYDEAWAESLAARASGAADARTLFHAGAIAAALADLETAGDLLARALALGPALDPWERVEANTLLAGVDSASQAPG